MVHRPLVTLLLKC